VIALDVLRTLAKEPAAAHALLQDLAIARVNKRHAQKALEEKIQCSVRYQFRLFSFNIK